MLSLAGNVFKKTEKKEAQIWPKMAKKKAEERRGEAPISFDYTAHFAWKMVENGT
jgi:hypothetical protein